MTFNLRFASAEPPHAWPERRPIMRRVIERETPDVFGTQEGLYGQLRDMAADLPSYDWIGLGREGGSRGEFMAVFFRRDKFEPVSFDHFWLSDTPDVIGSMTWGNRYRRMVTWVRLRERATGREFELWNTHFDHESETARAKSAGLLAARLARVDPRVPLLLVGDFNCLAGASAAYTTLTQTAGLTDAWLAAGHRTNDGLNTFHGYQSPKRAGERIDWILARQPASVTEAAIVDYAENGQTPSDHFPVTATVRFD
ncbi:MAG: endonuclease/exonuclease/phosphatase family protein [Opitutae bacterium]|nr:endonuclease/exonuclease/phosphatase family protein [Opitutae bacterium]